MKVTPFVVVVLAATLSLAAQQSPVPDIVTVDIVVGAAGDENKACSVTPTTVYVIGTVAFHCIDKKLISHAEEGMNKALEASYVKVATGQRVRWESKTHTFTIAAITAHTPVSPGSPGNPFNGNFPDTPASRVTSGAVVNIDGSVVQQYKVTFDIVGVGLVDPDVVCSM